MSSEIKPTSKKQREGVIVSRCLEYLALNGIFSWRNNTGAGVIDDRYIRFGHPGSADILGVLPDGRFLAVECKTKNGRMRMAQRVFYQMVMKNNGLYIVARNPLDIETVLASEGYIIPRPAIATM